MIFVQAVMVWRADKLDVPAWIERGELHGLGPPRLTMPPDLRLKVLEEIAAMNRSAAQHGPENQMSGNGKKQAE